MKKVYISGPITGHDDYYIRFDEKDHFLKAAGYYTINPAKITRSIPELEHREYMMICYPLVRIADAIYLLDGWETSKGAMIEVQWALEMDKEIMTASGMTREAIEKIWREHGGRHYDEIRRNQNEK